MTTAVKPKASRMSRCSALRMSFGSSRRRDRAIHPQRGGIGSRYAASGEINPDGDARLNHPNDPRKYETVVVPPNANLVDHGSSSLFRAPPNC